MFILKGCPRCGGDLSRGLDNAVTCLQCGHELPASGREALSWTRGGRVSVRPATAVAPGRRVPAGSRAA